MFHGHVPHSTALAPRQRLTELYQQKNSSTMSASVLSVISRFLEEYTTSTPNKLKVVDAYLLYILLTGALQFLYCLLVGTFPFNSFLSGFISCVGSFILAVCLRIQINPQNKGDFLSISPERAFADFLVAHTVLHLVVMNFIG
ncbi:dolichyl-diphosphooligosaccharide--protein glycosyltransferase subunit DAD1-like [Dunckerocampus dactyliophorus]|uniref:dolichyl-diphosphooligosaccharide--protein glycosyltransferase subunit DAD1-like n=1 Tax=Dunckerocampus dactyliophorus TaxID=161453 RepID=UPI002404AB7B|nr:dolichyl-diphosphooligosaccharide--protein glycosyltransferase subunit DAD1-like [Dunckerocampus dactyliophorus]XP_054620123.1 dolichyl-diphosphooligosaccharide--protein glycosyltransferase subunit DAD1-like [Dunckerocampus dactyliophorus]